MGTAKANVSGIRLSDRERAALSKAMGIHAGAERRRHRRYLLPKEFALIVRCEQPGGGVATFSVTPRDISISGIGFFHAAYMHPGTACTCLMRTLNGDPTTINGAVMRCRHVSGRIHEVGILFEHEVDIERFVADTRGNTPEPPCTTGRIEDVLSRVSYLAGELKNLAEHNAANGTLLAKVGELAILLSPPDELQCPASPDDPAPATPSA